MMVMIMNLAQT